MLEVLNIVTPSGSNTNYTNDCTHAQAENSTEEKGNNSELFLCYFENC